MPITEQAVQHWEHAPLHFKPNKYPQPLSADLPRMYFVGLFVGSRGSGKTFAIAQLLKQYERWGIQDGGGAPQRRDGDGVKVAQRVVLFSPTVDANPVFTSLTHLEQEDIVTSYSDEKLLAVLEDVKRERDETLEYQRQRALYRKFVTARTVDTLSAEELLELERMDFEPPKPPKYPEGCVCFFVLDDLIGSAAFKATGRSALTNLVLKNRHLGVNILIATQNLRAIPKSIRTNTGLFVIFRYANKRVITDDLYEEVSNTLRPEEFEDIFDYATSDDHACLVIDFSAPREARFKRNFDTVLRIQ